VLLCLLMPATEPELLMLHRAFDSWSGLGQITAGMTRQGWDVELKQHSTLGGGGLGELWLARYVSGMAGAIEGGAASGKTPCEAVQKAAWSAVRG
jgi:hypothetical protein